MFSVYLKRYRLVLISAVLLAIYHVIYSDFYPNRFGKLGHDLAYFFPNMLDGYYWQKVNGLFSIPWFTPSFCGGLPKFANPQAAYFSVPQFLTLFVNPLLAIQLTATLFGGIGFFGFYFLAKNIFKISTATAVFGATLFLFNTFYSHSLLTGHITFHSYMLAPMIALIIIRPANTKQRLFVDSALAGFLVAYAYYSGMSQLLPPLMLSVLAIGLIYGLLNIDSFRLRHLLLKFVSATSLAIALTLPSIISGISFLKHFPRDFYPLPGIPEISTLLLVLLESLFWMPDYIYANTVMVNQQWKLGRHEFEFGITFLPLIILTAGCLSFLYAGTFRRVLKNINPAKGFLAIALMLTFLVPLLLNYYSVSWNTFLKSIPFFKQSSTLLRWFSFYILPVIMLTTVILEKESFLEKYKKHVAIVGIAVVVMINIFLDRSYYHAQNYEYEPILKAYAKSGGKGFAPKISEISLLLDGKGTPLPLENRNNSIAKGFSYMFCYEPIFGYRLESFPLKNLQPGSVFTVREGMFNMKNPACYVYPEENSCAPGDHFKADQKGALEAFISYKPFLFKVPLKQKIANLIAGFLLFGYAVFFSFLTGRFIAKAVSRFQAYSRSSD